MWDANQYLKYADERSRPFIDLLSRVRKDHADLVVDLGCGPGTMTRTLSERWPAAQVIGVDQAPEMLAQTQGLAIPGRRNFVQADLATWSPDRPIDVIVSNAALQWVDDHESLWPRLAGMLSADGVLAVQMPYHFQSPAHRVIEETKADPRWKALLQGVGLHQKSVRPLAWYVERLHDLGFAVDAWQTTYLHVLTGSNPVLEWFKGSALRPLLQKFEPQQINLFLQELGQRLRAEYPSRGNVTLLPFTRLFIVAARI